MLPRDEPRPGRADYSNLQRPLRFVGARNGRQRRRHPPRGRPKARGTGVEADEHWGVVGLHRSKDDGELVATWTHPSKVSPCWYEPCGGTMRWNRDS